MLNRKHRFHGYNTLSRLYSRSQSVKGPLIGLRYSVGGPNKNFRVAVVVGKKVNKSAVTRNRIRRRVYEVVRRSNKIQDSYDYAFTVYSDKVAEISSEELVKLIDNLLSKTIK